MAEEHGWLVKVYDRTVAETAVGRTLTDDEWDRLCASTAWKMLGVTNQQDTDKISLVALDVLNAGVEIVTNTGPQETR